LPDVGVITDIVPIQLSYLYTMQNGIESVLVGDNTNHEQKKENW
jgi:hypothetical protein